MLDGIDPFASTDQEEPVRGIFGEEYAVETARLGHRIRVRLEACEGKTAIFGWLSLSSARDLGKRLIAASGEAA